MTNVNKIIKSNLKKNNFNCIKISSNFEEIKKSKPMKSVLILIV